MLPSLQPFCTLSSFSAGIDFYHQILTSKADPRAERVKSDIDTYICLSSVSDCDLSTMYIFNITCTQNIAISNTGYDVVLHDKYMPTLITIEQLVLYYTVIHYFII